MSFLTPGAKTLYLEKLQVKESLVKGTARKTRFSVYIHTVTYARFGSCGMILEPFWDHFLAGLVQLRSIVDSRGSRGALGSLVADVISNVMSPCISFSSGGLLLAREVVMR